jgi:hypothetical protein
MPARLDKAAPRSISWKTPVTPFPTADTARPSLPLSPGTPMTLYSPPVEAAIALARRAHSGQTDKAGAPYIGHPLRIMAKMASDDERIAAILHDVVEDSRDTATPVTFADLVTLGLPAPAIEAVRLLTRTDDGTDPAAYDAYIDAILANPVARKVKLADVEDNLDVTRLKTVTERDEKRLAKYRRIRARLLGAE